MHYIKRSPQSTIPTNTPTEVNLESSATLIDQNPESLEKSTQKISQKAVKITQLGF